MANTGRSLCKFTFNREKPVYFHDEAIEGVVTLTTFKPKTMTGISLWFKGEERLLWHVRPAYHRWDCVPDDSNSETDMQRYGDVIVCDIQCRDLRSGGLLQPGTYEFPFSIKLEGKQGVLTSCEGKAGRVVYQFLFKIRRLYRYDNVFVQQITVIKRLDLNKNPAFKGKNVSENPALFNCGGLIKRAYCTLTTPFGGYAPGQIIKYSLEMHNISPWRIREHCVKFIKTMTFTSKYPQNIKMVTHTVLMVQRYGRRNDNSFHGEFLIPPLPPTTFANEFIKVGYVMRAHVAHPCIPCSEMIAEIPIVIGTVPFIESLAPNQFKSRNVEQEILPEGEEQHVPVTVDDIIPPTFEEDTTCDLTFDDPYFDETEQQLSDYTPLYPVYRLPPSID